MTAKEKRNAMAKVFEVTQREMSHVVDECLLARRGAVPFTSQYEGKSVLSGPIPKDAHLVPSKEVIVKPELPVFHVLEGASLGASTEVPWASYHKPQPSVFNEAPAPATDGETGAVPADERAAPAADEELWRAQYMEWTLQKNAYNPDIAAQMRTNVRKQASLSMVDPTLSQDPARTSENVKAALSHSQGPVTRAPAKTKLDMSNYLPRDNAASAARR